MAAKRPTLHDVSRMAGVSTYTASRALNNHDGVSAASRQVVLDAARSLGYMPNRAAQELRTNTRRSIGVITASSSNAYYIDMMRGIERTLRPAGLTAVAADTAIEGSHTPELEEATVDDLVQSRVAGVIATLTLSERNMRLLADWDIPVVFVDSDPPAGTPQVPSVTMDNVEASMMVGAHLASHGYTDWLFLAYPPLWSTRAKRERGIREAAAAHAARIEVIESANDAESAYSTLRDYLRTRPLPRAIIPANNPMIHGTLRVMREKKVRVPEDVAIIGFDDFAWAPLVDPPLTVLDDDSEAIGALATKILVRIISEQSKASSGGRAPAPHYRPGDRKVVSGKLVIRNSCGC